MREHICLVSPAVSAQDERKYAASLLGVIVGDDTGSRYFWELVDNAMTETASMQFEAMDGTGAFYSYIRCSPENSAKVLEIVRKIFAELAASGITQEPNCKKPRIKFSAPLPSRTNCPWADL